MLLVDMPASGGGAPPDAKAALEAAASALRDRFPAMFSESLNCKPPHLCVDALRDKLFQARPRAASGGALSGGAVRRRPRRSSEGVRRSGAKTQPARWTR